MQGEGKRGGPIEIYPKFWILSPVARHTTVVLRIPAWTKSFEFTKRELETKLERDMLPAAIPELPTVRRMTLGMNSSMVVPSLHARATVEQQQKMFTDSWDPLFIGYLAAVYFHTCETKINSWTTQAKKMRGLMPPKYEVREVLRTLEKAGLESKLPIYDDGSMIGEEGHLALKDEMKISTRKYLGPYGLQEVESQQEGRKLDTTGVLYAPLTEYKVADPTTPSLLSVGTPGDKRCFPVENRFTVTLERGSSRVRRGREHERNLQRGWRTNGSGQYARRRSNEHGLQSRHYT